MTRSVAGISGVGLRPTQTILQPGLAGVFHLSLVRGLRQLVLLDSGQIFCRSFSKAALNHPEPVSNP